MDIGSKIKQRRIELGLSLQKVGDYVGVTKSTVQRWEQNQIHNMKRDKIQKLSEILLVSVPYILGLSEDIEDVISARLKTRILAKIDNMSVEQLDRLMSMIDLMF